MRTLFAFALFALALMGCPSSLGIECTTDCPSGYLCVATETVVDPLFYRVTRSVCARSCNTGRDCGAGINCYRGPDRFEQDPGYCNELGSAGVDALCSSPPPSALACGPGLTCTGAVCALACNLGSPYVEDRRCPAGMQCSLGYPGGYCVTPPCDPSLEPGVTCPSYRDELGMTVHQVCRRWTNPGLAEGTRCDLVEFARHCDDGTECVVGEICAEGRCFSQADAPPMTAEQVGVAGSSD